MADQIRLGIIGANIHRGWAVRSHLPAVVASPEFELTAVCTTRMESAEESRQLFGARLAFDDYHAMLAHPDIDAGNCSDLRGPTGYPASCGGAAKHEFPLQTYSVPSNVNSYRRRCGQPARAGSL